jgi:hypothetical protein
VRIFVKYLLASTAMSLKLNATVCDWPLCFEARIIVDIKGFGGQGSGIINQGLGIRD